MFVLGVGWGGKEGGGGASWKLASANGKAQLSSGDAGRHAVDVTTRGRMHVRSASHDAGSTRDMETRHYRAPPVSHHPLHHHHPGEGWSTRACTEELMLLPRAMLDPCQLATNAKAHLRIIRRPCVTTTQPGRHSRPRDCICPLVNPPLRGPSLPGNPMCAGSPAPLGIWQWLVSATSTTPWQLLRKCTYIRYVYV